MKWITKPPNTKSGWYWWKCSELSSALWPMEIGPFRGERQALVSSGLSTMSRYVLGPAKAIEGIWWTTKISEPEEPNDG